MRESNVLQPPQNLMDAYGKLPLSFEANEGQTDAAVRFLSRGRGYSLFLTSTESVIALRRNSRAVTETKPAHPAKHPDAKAKYEDEPIVDVLRIELVGGNRSPRIRGIDELPGKSSYFIGTHSADWRTDISTFRKIEYQSVYPGVDMIYYGNQDKLEYDLVVSPYADYRQIRLKFKGAKRIRIDKTTGDVILTTADGSELRQQKPVIYQDTDRTRVSVEGRYAFNRHDEITFRIGDYDPTKPLVIDPSFVYSTYLGGGADDIGYAVTADSSGNAYITGRTFSTNFPIASAFRSTNAGLRDIFVTKLNSTGSAILYSTYIGGASDDLAFAIALNSSNEAYLTGWTSSTNFPLVNALQPFYGGGGSDAFLVRLSASGNSLINSTYAGGSGIDVGAGVALDGARNIYGIGYTTSPDLTVTNAIQPVNAGGYDAYLLELSSSANSIVFATYAGGSGDDYGRAITVDSSGYIYAIGETNSINLTTVNPLQPFNAGGFDAFLGKLSPSGTSIVFSSYAGGSGDDGGTSLAIDPSGNIYAAGFTNSTNLQLIVNAVQPNKAAGYDAFVGKLNSSGTTIFYSTFLGGNGDDYCLGVSADAGGNVYLTGQTLSTNFPTLNALRSTNAGAEDVFITKLNSSGSSILFSTYLGGSAGDAGESIVADANGNAYVTGITFSTNFSTSNPIRAASGGGSDAFVAKINTTTTGAASLQLSQSSYSINEGSDFLSITVTRTGDTSAAATVKYVTSDATDVNFQCNPASGSTPAGAASRKCDYHIAVGRLRFAAGETSKQIILSIVKDVYVEPSESLTITLSNPTGATLGLQNTATVNITDNDTAGQANPIDGTAFYVRMLYVDLLSREPDPAGFAGWVHRIDFCGQPGEPPPPCDRVTVGGDGFLRSGEFFDREFFVLRLYRAGLGRILIYPEVGDLAYVSGFLTASDLELNKQDLVAEIMSRPEFSGIYNSLGNAAFVDKLIQTAAVTIPQTVRDGWVNALNGSSKTRAQVYRELSERQEVSDRYLHEAQVVSCYYGFFTRNPDGAYFNYLDRLDRGEINLGDLANAFINAAEYKQRFGP